MEVLWEKEMKNKSPLLLVPVFVVGIIFFLSTAASALMIVGDPIEGNSWRQRFRENLVGNFDTIEVSMYSGNDFKTPGFENFNRPWNVNSYSNRYVWGSGGAVTNLEWDIIFEGDLSEPLTFVFKAWHGGILGNLLEAVLVRWTGFGFDCTSMSVPDADIMWLLGPVFIGFAIVGRKKYRTIQQ